MKNRTALLVVTTLAIAAATLFGSALRADAFFQPNCNANPAPHINWSFCDKRGIHLVDADLREAVLAGANFAQASFSYSPGGKGSSLVNAKGVLGIFTDASFAGVSMRGANFTSANFSSTAINASQDVFADLDDSGSKWVEARLVKTRFDSLNLSHADFSEADMAGASFKHTSLDHANLYRVRFDGGILLGVTLRYASLEDAHMVNMKMFPFQTMQKVDFTGANLRGAVIELRPIPDSYWKYIHFSNTTCPDGSNSDHDGGQTCRGHGFN